MNQDDNKIYDLINNIPITPENSELIQEIRNDLEKKDYKGVLKKIEKLKQTKNKINDSEKEKTNYENRTEESQKSKTIYPKIISDIELERKFIGL